MGRFVRGLVDPKEMKGDTEIGYIGVGGRVDKETKVFATDLYPEVFAMLKAIPKLFEAGAKAMETLHTIADGADHNPDWEEGGEYHKVYEGLGAALKAAREARLGNVPQEEP